MLGNFPLGPTIVGIVATEPMRLTGLVSAFEGHPTIRTAIGDLDTMLADTAMHYIIWTANPTWMEMQFLVNLSSSGYSSAGSWPDGQR